MTRRLPVWKVYERGIFSTKNGISKGKGWDLGAEPPRIKFVSPGHNKIFLKKNAKVDRPTYNTCQTSLNE